MATYPSDPFLIYKRLGTKDSPFVQYNSPIRVTNGKVYLTEIPNQNNHVTVTDGTNSYSEVYSQASLSTSNNYYVDYDNGIVYFDPSHNNKLLTFSFLGEGIVSIPATRVFTQSSNGSPTQDLQDMIDNYNQLNGTDLYNLFDPQTGHKHTGASGDAPPIDSQHVNYSGNGVSSTSNVKDTLDSHAAQLAEIVSLVPSSNGVDDTANIQAILNSPVRSNIVRIPKGTYYINAVNTSGNNDKPNGGLLIPSNTILEIDPDAVLQAITNNSETYSILRVQDSSNVIIRGGTIKGERNNHTGTTGEWGYGICLNGVTNVSVEDVIIQDCWGDGIFLNAGIANDANPCQNVKIKGVVSNNNRRQGMSIQFANGVFVYGSKFINTNGTSPQSGVDIEPGISNYSTKNIHFVGCEFSGNAGDGFQTQTYVSQAVLENSRFLNNSNRGISVYQSNSFSVSNNIIQGHTAGAGIELNGCTDISVIGNKSLGNQKGINLLSGAVKNTINGNTCNANSQNGISAVGATDNVISDNVCEGNTQEGIYAYSASNLNIINNVCEGNSIGIHLTTTSNNNQVIGNYCRKNNNEGIKADGSHHNSIQTNTCLENSQTTNVAADNILLYQCNYNNIQGNTCRKGATSKLPRYGVFVQDSASTGNMLMQNDCYTGGSTGGVANTGTSTLFGSGNRNNDGTFSATPN